jgi:hypothetical protein
MSPHHWFEPPPICVCDFAKPGVIRQVSNLQMAASELLKWPKTKKRDKAVQLVANAHTGIGKMVEAKKAFEAAAKDARVWIPYRGP